MNVLFVMLGFIHLAALISIILYYCHHVKMPWREWPMMLYVLLWATLVVTACIVSLFDGLHNLSSYFFASFLGVGFVLAAHYAVIGPSLKTPYARLEYPEFTVIKSVGLRRFLWWLLLGTLAAALMCHLLIVFSFYPVNADSLNYRLARVFWYSSNGNLLHPFVSGDKRLTFYPLDGIMMYVPLLLYGVSTVFWGLPSIFSWLAIGYTTYRFARALNAERLIAAFAAWLVAMTPSILIEASSTNDEILTAAPLVIGLFFLWRWLTTGAGHYFFLAAIGAGLCVGTKLHVFFLIPIAIGAAVWFFWYLWRRQESWRQWIPELRLPVFLASAAAFTLTGLLFLFLNFVSSGQFYFLKDTAVQVLNLGASFQDALQNFVIYVSSIIFAPIADMIFWQDFHQREQTNLVLNSYFMPLIAPFVDTDPKYFHLHYQFKGVIIPTSVLLVEYGLWPAYMWLAWPLQFFGFMRKEFTLRRFFVVLAATPLIWLVIWSCVTLYMEGVPTYFAFYLMCAAPAMVMCFVKARTPKRNTIRWWVIGFMLVTNLIINANVIYNNTFRGLWHVFGNRTLPYDWLMFQQPIIDEIQRAKKIQIAITHGKVYYFSFMHWNPEAIYYSPYQAAPPGNDILHILTTPSEASYGFMPIKIPGKPSFGITYLGHIRGVDREEVFAFGNSVEQRHRADSDFISLHVDVVPDGKRMKATMSPLVAGLNSEDHLEFSYVIKSVKDEILFVREWNKDPSFETELPPSPIDAYVIIVSVRITTRPEVKPVEISFGLGGKGTWRITRAGEDPADNNDDDDE